MKRLISSVVTLVLVASVVAVPAALAQTSGQATGNFTILGEAPVVTSVALYDLTGATPQNAMNPQVEYKIKVAVSDANTLNDLVRVNVTLFYDADGVYNVSDVPTAGETQTAAILSWVPGPTWSIDPTGGNTTWSVVTGNCTEPNLTLASGTFEFNFNPGKVATETIDPAKWHIYANVTDNSSLTDDNYQENIGMNWYGAITLYTASVSWGAVLPGLDFGGNNSNQTGINATYIANGDYDETVAASVTWTGTSANATLEETGNPVQQQFSLKANDIDVLGNATLVMAEPNYVVIDDSGTQTLEEGDNVNTNTLWLKLGTPFVNETYTGSIYYAVADG